MNRFVSMGISWLRMDLGHYNSPPKLGEVRSRVFQRTAGWFLKRTTPSGPSKKASRHFLEGAATPPNLGGVLDLRLTWGMVNGETSNEQPLWAARNQEERLRELVGN